ncbi:hypothetical protein GF391_00870 [Candidatus Uhrbacteria bacterium]|nr:hypothetical protein [Candidatus Uhrbacteria bacterium]
MSDLFQDSMARLLEKSIYASTSKRSQKANRAVELADTAMAHVVAIGVLVKMEPKMAQDAKELIRSKKKRVTDE